MNILCASCIIRAPCLQEVLFKASLQNEINICKASLPDDDDDIVSTVRVDRYLMRDIVELMNTSQPSAT